jgi:hypothetical protein
VCEARAPLGSCSGTAALTALGVLMIFAALAVFPDDAGVKFVRFFIAQLSDRVLKTDPSLPWSDIGNSGPFRQSFIACSDEHANTEYAKYL